MKRESREVECWFLIPIVRDSDRGPHQPVLWKFLEEALSDAWGGWTGPERMEWGRKRRRFSRVAFVNHVCLKPTNVGF